MQELGERLGRIQSRASRKVIRDAALPDKP